MKRLTILGIFVIVGIMFTASAVLSKPAGPQEGLDVKIVNPIPLPVTGDVNVINETMNPVNVKEVGAVQCKQEHIVFDLNEPYSNGTVEVNFGFLVPSEKVFVIEMASVSISRATNADTTITKLLVMSGPNVEELDTGLFYMPLTLQEAVAVPQFAGLFAVKAVVSENRSIGIQFSAETANPGDLGWVKAYINGYYTDANCPQP